jgi:hypothetical protein
MTPQEKNRGYPTGHHFAPPSLRRASTAAFNWPPSSGGLVAADRVADERLIMLAVRFGLAWDETSTEATDSDADGAIESGSGKASGAD